MVIHGHTGLNIVIHGYTCLFAAKHGNTSLYMAIFGLETAVSVLFTNTRTRRLYNEREIFNTARGLLRPRAVLKILSSLYSQQVLLFVHKTRTNSL